MTTEEAAPCCSSFVEAPSPAAASAEPSECLSATCAAMRSELAGRLTAAEERFASAEVASATALAAQDARLVALEARCDALEGSRSAGAWAVQARLRLDRSGTPSSPAVTACCYTSDGRHVLLASWDSTLRLADAHSGAVTRCFAATDGGHSPGTWLRDCALSPGGALAASVGSDGTVRVWSLSTGQCARTVDSPSLCCAWSPDRYGVHGASPALLVTGGADGVLRVWDVAGGSCVRALSDARPPPAPPHTAAAAAAFAGAAGPPAVGRAPGVTCVAVAPDGANLLSGSHDACLRVWSAATGRRAALLLGHAATVYCCAFSRDGRAAASAAGDGEARTWDPATGACRAVLAPQGPPGGGIGGGGGGPVFACCFGGGADGRLVLTAGGDGRLRWWDGATGECLATLRADGTRDGGAQGGGGEPAAVFCAAIRPDGRALAAGDASGRLRLWTRL